MARTVQVSLGERSYGIRIGRDVGLSPEMGGGRGHAALLVSDSHVDPLYGGRWESRLRESGFETFRAVVPAGEASKSLASLGGLYETAAERGLDRNSCVFALGGGVIGDLAGFMAATYLRGVRLVQIPTTLLAMVDSSVGGKTAINLPQGKNLVGAFYQPAEVLADLNTLDTLPRREYVSGLAEVVKYGVIRDATLFGFLETHAELLLQRHLPTLEEVVARCCEIKADVVSQDERDLNLRAILNFGHTLGHALENVAGYGEWLHGEAVALGMVFAARLSVRTRGMPEEQCDRLVGLLRTLELPVSLRGDSGQSWDRLRQAMMSDKKTLRRAPRFVLIPRLGETMSGCEIPDRDTKEIWDVCCQ